MRKRFQFKSIGARLTFWFFIMAMLPLIMVNIAIYIHMVHSIKVSVFNKIESIRDLKVLEVNHWLKERISDIYIISASDEIRLLEIIQSDREEISRPDMAIISREQTLLNNYLKNYDDFHEISIVDPHTNKILVSTDRKNEGKVRLTAPHVTESFRGGELFIEDIHYPEGLDKPSMAFSIPIFSLANRSTPIGLLVASINLESSLYKLLLNRTGVGKTGETLIVNKDIIALNELRWHKDAVLKLKIESGPARKASRGKTGIVETDDYRGEMVLAAYTHIPMTGWGFVAKQDLKEVYAPIYGLRKWMFAIVIMTLSGVIIVAFRVSKSISRPIKVLHKGSEIIGNGNLDHRVGTGAHDEIGELSRTFDHMIEKLKTTTASWDELNREIVQRKHLEKTLLEIEEHERRRIGHDLHDNLGQQLTGISFKTKGLENILRKKSIPEAEDAERIAYLIEMSKAQLKSLSIGLAPMFGNDEYSLATALAELASNSEKLFGIHCDLKCNKFVRLYYKSALIHLYRIAQEAITNAARHAKPDKIEIRLSKKHDEITMSIRDDGLGFSTLHRTSGMGLEIMKYRAAIINASIDIRPDSKKGTRVTCVFYDKQKSETNITEKLHNSLSC